MEQERQIPIWFFIGILLIVYGVLILGAGLYGLKYPPPEAQRVALWNLHADLWWGVLLLVLGTIYTVKFRPREGEGLTGREPSPSDTAKPQ